MKYSKEAGYYQHCNKGKLWNYYITSKFKSLMSFEKFLKTYKDEETQMLWNYLD